MSECRQLFGECLAALQHEELMETKPYLLDLISGCGPIQKLYLYRALLCHLTESEQQELCLEALPGLLAKMSSKSVMMVGEYEFLLDSLISCKLGVD